MSAGPTAPAAPTGGDGGPLPRPGPSPVGASLPAPAGDPETRERGTAYPAGHRSPADWIGLVARLVLGGIMLYAGLTKVGDLTGSVQNVMAYEIFPYEISRAIGILLPVVEIALGVLLLVGLLTRASAAVVGALMTAFVVGIISAWARGLSIDCGCFGTGGTIDPEDTTYLLDIVRDLALLLLALWLTIRPRTPWSLDLLLTKGR